MRYHQGDDFPFVWRRVRARKKATKTGIRKSKA
jgi:hypothetical protein